jgi:hypothetical protein
MPNTPITSQLPEDIRSLGNNGTFCVLPWIHDYRTLSGKKFACCVSHADGIALEEDNNSTSNQQFRLDLWNGTRRKECGPCYRSEDNGIVSYRQNHNNQWLGNPRVQEPILFANFSRPPRSEAIALPCCAGDSFDCSRPALHAGSKLFWAQ